MSRRRHLPLAAVFAVVMSGLPALARGAEQILQVRTIEDPSVPPDPAVCAAAPFASNVRLGASVWAYELEKGVVKLEDEEENRLGTATACLRLTSFAFTPFTQSLFYIRFSIGQASYTGLGSCTITSNDVPVRGIVLAGCNLKVIDSSDGSRGAISSNSIFNPFRLPGYDTGSFWTLRLYR